MKFLFRIVRNLLAVIGLFGIIGIVFLFLLLMLKTGLPPLDLAGKILYKGAAFVLQEKSFINKTPVVDPDQFQPVELSQNVSTIPVDESVFYDRRILRVGQKQVLKMPSEAARIAKAHDIIEIDAGSYVGDTALWTVPQLTIRGVGGRAVLDAGGKSIEGKAIWVIRADDIFIENIGFKNCKVKDHNGAGIRVEGDNLKIRNCLFWSNENGILGNGGEAIVIGNVLHQNEFTENSAMIHYGMPNSMSGEPFYIVNNTVLSDRRNGIFLLNHSPAKGSIVNNLLVGKLEIAIGNIQNNSNLSASMACFYSPAFNHYDLNSDCPAINSGTHLNNVGAIDLIPVFEYIHPLSKSKRKRIGKLDIGAYEYTK